MLSDNDLITKYQREIAEREALPVPIKRLVQVCNGRGRYNDA